MNRKKIIIIAQIIALTFFLWIAFMFGVLYWVKTEIAKNTPTETEQELSEPETEEEYLYILCEVTEINTDTYMCLMPNGELHEFFMFQDPPIDDNGNPYFEQVFFKVHKANQDDYTKYKPIGVI